MWPPPYLQRLLLQRLLPLLQPRHVRLAQPCLSGPQPRRGLTALLLHTLPLLAQLLQRRHLGRGLLLGGGHLLAADAR